MGAIIPDSETNHLYKRMCEARQEWESASLDFEQAVGLYHDVEGNADGITAVRASSTREIEALKRYRETVQAYAQAVRNGGPA